MPRKRGARKRKSPSPDQGREGAPSRRTTSLPEGFPIVGIGASAGGLDAFERFLAAMPAESGIAFVLIPHLDPAHPSLMGELLAKQTAMKVVEAEHGMPVEPNRVYVIPPNRYLSIESGRLLLDRPSAEQAWRPAIDPFFRSLAHDQREKAIGIILSGTGSYGVLGLKEIKLTGGMVMVQDPKTAAYDQMPQSAIGTGIVDFILAPEKMPEVLLTYVAHPYLNHVEELPSTEPEPASLFDQILAILKASAKCDFRQYRRKFLLHRIQRRMGLRQIEELAAYVKYLRENPGEVAALSKDLLISVTGFFRDPEAFQVLEQNVIPDLVKRQSGSIPLRVWVPGCATGEEAYSLAMLLLEEFSRQEKLPCLQVFASDIDQDSLQAARRGLYPETISADVSRERLKRFFSKMDDHYYEVSKSLRELILFAPQDVLRDAPFSKLDLLSCRNLLIYLEREVQKNVLSLFHFALNENGFLFLGPSESIGDQTELFKAVSKKWRVYKRLGVTRRGPLEFPIRMVEEFRHQDPLPAPSPQTEKSLAELMQKLLLADYAPAAVLINPDFEVLYFFGPTSHFLEFPRGGLTKDLLAMARQGLRTTLQAACHHVIHGRKPVAEAQARVCCNGSYTPCLITVKAAGEIEGKPGLLLVTFQDQNTSLMGQAASSEGEANKEGESILIRQLEYELNTSRQDLQNTIEELETSNEELRASNEEVQSMNEELRSVIEELRVSKEELQSLNEELNAVNCELQARVTELDRANNDVSNLLTSSEIAIVFLDRELRIRRFSPATAKLLNLLAGDIGRPLSDLAMQFSDDHLIGHCREVLRTLTPAEAVIQTEDSRWYLRRILPYRTADDRIDGVGVTFVDVTEQKQYHERLRTAHRRLEAVIETAPVLIVVTDSMGRIVHFNTACEKLTGYTRKDVMGERILDRLVPSAWRAIVEARFTNRDAAELCEPHEAAWVTRTGEERLIEWRCILLPEEEQPSDWFLLGLGVDVTDRKRAEEALSESGRRISAILNTAADAIITIDQQGIIDQVNPRTEAMFGYQREELIGRNIKMLMPPPYCEEHDDYIRRYLETGKAKIIGIGREVKGLRKDGSTFPMDLAVSRFHDQVGLMFTGIIRDITERKAEQERLIQSERLAALGEAMAGLTHESRNALARSQGNLQRLARRLKGSEEFQQLIAAAQRANDDIRRQFDEVREFAAPLNLHREPTDLGQLVRQAWENLCEDRASRQAELRIEKPTSDVTCNVDQFSMCNAFRNILDNALAAGEDPTEIDIGFSEVTISGWPALRISFRDNGPGLPPDMVERAFDAFYTTKTRGTGLGLAIVKRTVESHGGQVAFRTSEGRGAEILITLPRIAS